VKWFRPGVPENNGNLVLEFDAEFSAQIRRVAAAWGQPPEALVAELVARGLEEHSYQAWAREVLEAHLTPREQEVAWLAVAGLTNREIANLLVISPETVKVHMRNILRKFGVHSKSGLRILLRDLGDQRPEW